MISSRTALGKGPIRACPEPTRHAPSIWRVGFALWLGAAAAASAVAVESPAEEPSQPATTAAAPSKFRSEEDGWFDVSGFLDKAYGFVPLVIPITEPAVGYGAAGGLVFIDRPLDGAQSGAGRPNITVVGGLATENGTWGAVVGDVRHWHDDRLQTVAGAVDASVNLDFYGVGEDDTLNDDPLRYNLAPLGGGVRARYRMGASDFWIGGSYALVATKIRFDEPSQVPGTLDVPSESRVGGLTPSLAYDSRDNLFTPTRGTYFEGSVGLFDEALGGDSNFQRVGLSYIRYMPLHPRLTLGVRAGATFTYGDTPFYMLPYISLRGVPVLRYQGEDVAEVETEARWQFWKRFSLVGFVGGGGAWNDFENVANQVGVVTGGTGFRYELARKYGLHAGVDVAFGPDGTVFYIQLGSAWARP